MPDFTFHTFKLLLKALKEQQYTFQTFAQFLKDPAPRAIILRHDVDARKLNSLKAAQIEAEMGIVGTFNFRIDPQSFDQDVIKQVADLGHEIGYHYEDFSIAKGDYDQAIMSFEQNLAKLRHIVPVETICMHGSPLSRYDNRKLWEKYNYRNYGILGEPYFDLDFSKILYLTDTGRRWDGERVSVRDKVKRDEGQGTRDKEEIQLTTVNRQPTTDTPSPPLTKPPQATSGTATDNHNYPQNNLQPLQPTTDNRQPPHSHTTRPLSLVPCPLSSSFDIIRHASLLPDQIMINIHPQRWDDRPLPWIKEYVWQNLKNVVKRMIAN